MKKTVVLLAMALMAGCVSEKTYQQEVQQVGTLSAQNKTYQALNQQLQAEVRADQVQLTQLQGCLKVSSDFPDLSVREAWPSRDDRMARSAHANARREVHAPTAPTQTCHSPCR